MSSFGEQKNLQKTVKSGEAAIFDFPAISSEPAPSVRYIQGKTHKKVFFSGRTTNVSPTF